MSVIVIIPFVTALPATNGELNQGQAMCVMDKYSDLLYNIVNKFGSNNTGAYAAAQDS